MAPSEVVNPSIKSDLRSSKKKKAAKTAATETTSQVPTIPEHTQSNGLTLNDNSDGPNENSYFRELQKNIRNVNKKITNASKVDNVIAENPDKTLDELVAARKINPDQKAQILKKPALQATLAHLEEQATQFTILNAEFKTRSHNEKLALEKILREEAMKEKEDAVASAKIDARVVARKHLEESLLLISQFLKLAAIRRAEEEAAELEESKALEGLLAQVYSGDASAVVAMLNLIDGTDETLKSVNGEALNVTYASLKATSKAQVPYIECEVLVNENEVLINPAQSTTDDPVITDAGTAEASTTNITGLTNGNGHSDSHQIHQLVNSSVIDSCSDKNLAETPLENTHGLLKTQECAQVPSINKSEKKYTSNVTGPIKGHSWADDQPDTISENPSIQAPAINDGFQEIQRNRGGRSSRGRYTDGHRGRGNHRGESYRGRGRGGGGNRGSRRSDD